MLTRTCDCLLDNESASRCHVHHDEALSDINLPRLHQSIANLSGNRVMIIGDVMLDQYIFGSVDRISPEAPVPVVMVDREEYRLGGASNVARNVAALGGECLLGGIVGDDGEGQRLRMLLAEQNIKDYCHVDSSRPTTTKTRVIAQQQQVVRIDRELCCNHGMAAYEHLLGFITSEIHSCSVVIISDYGKGLITREFMNSLRNCCRRQELSPIILVDPKPHNFHCYHGVDLLTPNTKEAGIDGVADCSMENIASIGISLRERLGSKGILITLGARGMMLVQSPNKAIHIPTAARTVYDVTGAGDTVIAVLGLALAAGASHLMACLLANYAAGVVVSQVGAASVNRSQLEEAVQSWTNMGLKQIQLNTA